MSHSIDLEYDPHSFAGPFDLAELTAFEDWLRDSGYANIVFPDEYISHVSRYHGGVPRKKYFDTVRGSSHAVTRFLNFLSTKSGDPLAHYGVETTWSSMSDRTGLALMPFAELFGGDMACFDFSHPGQPSVVVWDHELSTSDRPHTELVAPTFSAFIDKLRSDP